MRPVRSQAKDRLRPSVARLADIRRLLSPWVYREVRAHYRQSTLDLLWSLITPAITVVGYGLVLTRFFGVDGGGVPYLPFAWSGIVLWTFVAGGLIGGSWSLVSAADLIRKVYFPREVVPIAAVLTLSLDLIVGLIILGIIMVFSGMGLSVTVIAAVPALVGLLLWTIGCAIGLATLTAFKRDSAHGISAILRIGIFVTPIMYPVSQIPKQYRWVASANPIAVFVESFRDAVLRDLWPRWDLLIVHTIGAIAIYVLALKLLRRAEGSMSDVI